MLETARLSKEIQVKKYVQMKYPPFFCNRYMNILEKRDVNKTSFSGHLIPKSGDKNKFLHAHTHKRGGFTITVER